MTSDRIQILIIEDDIEYAEIIKMCLDEPDSMGMRFELERADRLAVGLKLLEAARFDAVLLDLTLPDSRGLETIQRVIDGGCGVPILVMTSLGDESTAFEAMRLGAQDYMVKATSDSRLLKRAIWYAIERHKLLTQSETIIKKSADGMAVIDADGLVRYLNPAGQAIFGAPAERMLGRPFPFPAVPGETSLQKIPSEPREKSVEMKFVEINWKGRPARLASIRDITELQRIEQLKAEIRERRRLDQLKDELIGTVSHELRTPLTIVKGAIDNLREGIAGEMQPKQRDVVDLAHRNVLRLAKMINNLLDLSRLESGVTKVSRRPIDILPVIEEVTSGLRLTDGHGAKIETELSESLPLVVADAEMIAQVLTNLVDNALRFARSRVVVKASLLEDGALVEVIDDGPGISKEKLGALFNKFVQINRSAGAGYKGTGLGLAICKEIMTLHGTKIDVSSTVGAGTRFSFRLPRRVETAAAGKIEEHRA